MLKKYFFGSCYLNFNFFAVFSKIPQTISTLSVILSFIKNLEAQNSRTHFQERKLLYNPVRQGYVCMYVCNTLATSQPPPLPSSPSPLPFITPPSQSANQTIRQSVNQSISQSVHQPISFIFYSKVKKVIEAPAFMKESS